MVSAERVHRGAVVAKLYDFVLLVSPLLVCEPLLLFAKNHWGLRWRLRLVRQLLRMPAGDSSDSSGSSQGDMPPRMCTLLKVEGSSQRVQEDSLRLVRGFSRLLAVMLDSVVSLCLFSGVLWHTKLCMPWADDDVAREGWLFLVCVGSCCAGLCVSWCLGSALVLLENSNQAVEANFRKLLLHLECSSELLCDAPVTEMQPVATPPVATSTHEVHEAHPQQEFEEISLLNTREIQSAVVAAVWQVLQQIRRNYSSLYACWVRLSCFLGVLEQGMVVLPYVLVSPWLVGSAQHSNSTDLPPCGVTLGTMVAVSNCFQKVFHGLNAISDHMTELTELRSVVLRLKIFTVQHSI